MIGQDIAEQVSLIGPTWYANIWVAGDHHKAVELCREFCGHTPLRVTVTPTTYVCTGGAEEGVCVRSIQYPRFPEDEESRTNKVIDLAEFLRSRLCQHSYCVEFQDETVWDGASETP